MTKNIWCESPNIGNVLYLLLSQYNQFDNKDQKSTGIAISSENVSIGLNLENGRET